MFGNKVGTTMRQSFSDAPEIVLALASKTTLNFVVELLSFTTPAWAFSSDISKMYCAVELYEQDRDFHWLLWHTDKASEVLDYQITKAILLHHMSLSANS